MKKTVLISILVSLLFISSYSGASINTGIFEEIVEDDTNLLEKSYTHTVLIEVGTGSWCYWCQFTNAAMHEIYSWGTYDFEYVELVDSNPISDQRIAEFNIAGYPTSFFDGGYKVYVGGSSDTSDYTNLIDASGARSVPDLSGDLTVIWVDNEKLDITVNIDNNEGSNYNGHLHVYVVEIESRWLDNGGAIYNNGLLGYAFNQDISISAGGTFSDNTLFDGSSWNNPDITSDNIKVILAVFNSQLNQGYADPPSGNPFDAYYNDFTIAATPSSYPVTIIDPIPYYSSSVVNITGRSSGAFINNAFLTIKDITNSKYWDGDSWESSQIWLDATPVDGDWGDGTEEWYYDTSMVSWIDGNEFMITAKSIDDLGREDIEPPTVTFYYDSIPPDTIITQGPTGVIDYNDVFIEWMGSDEHSSYFVYQYKLGIDSDWSVWLADTSIEYNGLMDGDYIFMVKAKDAVGNVDPTPANISFTVNTGGGPQNNAPFTPQINGPSNGEPGSSYDYTIVTTDPEFDDVFYYVEWGDGTVEEWIGSYSSGEQISINHTWDIEDTYVIRVKAKDLQGAESDWATLEISIPKNKIKNSIPFGLNLAFGLDVDVKIIRVNQLEDYVDLELLSKPFYIWHNELTSYNPGAFIRLYDAKGLFNPSISFCFGICSDWAIIG